MTSEVQQTSTDTKVNVGDRFTFVTYIDGKPTQLTGCVEVMMPSAKARMLGLTKSKRRRLFLGLKVEGYPDLFYKDKGQVKSAHYFREHQELVKEKRLIQKVETLQIISDVKRDLQERS